jgi:hypothetical protein
MQRMPQLRQRSSCQRKSAGTWTSPQPMPPLQALIWPATPASIGTSHWRVPAWNRRTAMCRQQQVMQQRQPPAARGTAVAPLPSRCWLRSWTAAMRAPGDVRHAIITAGQQLDRTLTCTWACLSGHTGVSSLRGGVPCMQQCTSALPSLTICRLALQGDGRPARTAGVPGAAGGGAGQRRRRGAVRLPAAGGPGTAALLTVVLQPVPQHGHTGCAPCKQTVLLQTFRWQQCSGCLHTLQRVGTCAWESAIAA